MRARLGDRLRHASVVCVAVALLCGCAGPGQQMATNSQQFIDSGQPMRGLEELEKAMAAEPGNREYRMQWFRLRELVLGQLLTQADARLAEGKTAEALTLFEQAVRMAPGNARATSGVNSTRAALRLDLKVDEAQALLAQGLNAEAAQRLRAVLVENPAHVRAQSLIRQIEPTSASSAAPDRAGPALKTALKKSVTLDFRDANLRAVFDALSRSTGINFVFDREVRSDLKISISIANASVEDIIGTISATQQLDRKVLNQNTVLIYPNTPAKQREHLDLNIKTFYLSNTDAKGMVALLKTVLKTKDLYADEKLNTMTMRDTADAIRLAERMVAAQDQAEPEVLLDVEILEIKRSRMIEIGLEPPGRFTVLNLVKNPDTVITSGSGTTTVVNNTLTSTQLTLDALRGLTGGQIGIDSPVVNFRAENGDTNILANPRIRVKNREKARIMIGDRVPVITTTTTANVGVAESVSYLDVGLKLEVEPRVHLNNEVGVTVLLEVSNIVREIKSRTGSLTYQIGTRLANTALRLKDGETQALAGLIGDEDRKSTVGAPGMVDLPVIGRLFSSQRSENTKTEIVLLITPRVVRNIDAEAATRFEYASGTELAVGAAPLRLQGSGRIALPPNAAKPAPSPDGEPPAEPQAEPQPETPAEAPAQLPQQPAK